MFEKLIEKINTIEANVNLLLELHIEQVTTPVVSGLLLED